MPTMLATLTLLIQLVHLGTSNPVALIPRAADASDFEIGTTIPLRISKLDLQHSSNALRKRAVNLHLAQNEAASPDAATYQSGYALLRSTAASSFLAPISFGDQSFLAILDTGSADTWVAGSKFQCLDLTGRPKPQERCYFANLYPQPDAGAFKQTPNSNFNITYGDGEFLTGSVGTLDVALAGIKVPNQTVSIVDQAAWLGDGQSSGLIGLAYPALTAVYPGTDPRQDRYCGPGGGGRQCDQIVYSSLMDNMFFQQKSAKPVFALALSRDESGRRDGGYLTVGGIPRLSDVGVKSNVFASTKIKVLPMDDRLRYYLIGVEGLVMLPVGQPIPADAAVSTTTTTTTRTSTTTSARTSSTRSPRPTNGRGGNNNGGNWWQKGGLWGGNGGGGRSAADNKVDKREAQVGPASGGTSIQNSAADYIVDSGTTLSFFPDAQARTFNSMFSPPARFDRTMGFYMVECNAKIPSLGVKIGGMIVWHSPKDLIKPFGQGLCVSGIQSSMAMGVNILGDVFLNSVLAVFDLGAGVIKFADRRDYQS